MEFLEHGSEKPIIKVENLSNLEQMIRSGEIQKKLNSNSRPLCEGNGETKDLPTMAPRVEARNETRNLPCGRKRSLGGRNSATLNFVSKQTLEHR
ncbi:hypothetical protein AVEN_70518-1 [Araneus ventricosus]|uniref:Uncharacterized protein n=1 Tax=Araneus ventricosus TaxID=182803 RepID=A0A4Y2WWZ8_ARAVE|nr:hypothetical protein AVEN_70518-1 [Araneus ventricosus]